jgi:hypothetical protein
MRQCVSSVPGVNQTKKQPMRVDRSLKQSFTTSSGDSERCSNPLCHNRVEPLSDGRWRRTERRFCSDHCKTLAWAIRKTAEAFKGITDEQTLHILKSTRR